MKQLKWLGKLVGEWANPHSFETFTGTLKAFMMIAVVYCVLCLATLGIISFGLRCVNYYAICPKSIICQDPPLMLSEEPPADDFPLLKEFGWPH